MRIHCVTVSVFHGVVRITVDFEDQSLLWTEKVDNAVADDVLASKLEPAELRFANAAPELCLKWRESFPEPPCPIEKMQILHQRRTPPLPLP